MGLVYNGIDLGSYLLTKRIVQGPVYDPSRTDQLYTRINLSVRSIINPSLNPATAGETPAVTAARIRHMLCAPRKSLVYSIGATNYINLPSGLDDANGPKPDEAAFTITEVTPDTFLVEWSCAVCQTDCSTSRPYLSNRWSESVTQDREWLTVKHRTGVLILSSRSTFHPDDFRGVVAPALDIGFRRESAKYRVSEDNLTVHYEFTDRELAKAPPFPATSMRGQMVESIPVSGAGVLRRGEISLQLKGPKSVPSRDLLNAAIGVAVNRVRASGVLTVGGRMFVGGAISESLNDDENAVGVNVQWQMKPNGFREGGRAKPSALSLAIAGAINGIGASVKGLKSPTSPPTPEGKSPDALPMNANWVGLPLDGTTAAWPIGTPTRGTAETVRIAAAALNDPCGSTSDLRSASVGNESVLRSSDGTTTVSTLNTAELPDDDQAMYADDGPGVWEEWTLKPTYFDDPGLCVMPAAKKNGSASGVQVHGGLLCLEVDWHVKKTGGQPVPPTIPEIKDGNWLYVGGQVTPSPVELAADGVSLIFEADGQWRFCCLDRSKATIAWPLPPWIDQQKLAAGGGIGAEAVLAANAAGGGGTSELKLTPVGFPTPVSAIESFIKTILFRGLTGPIGATLSAAGGD